MKLRFRENEQGFSLIELIVSILIMSVIAAMVVLLMSSSRRTYRSVNADAVVQSESELVRKFIGELALEARSWGQRTVKIGGKQYKTIWIKALDNDTEGLERGSYTYTYQKVDEYGNPVFEGGNPVMETGTRQYYYYVFLLRSPEGPLAYGKYKYDDLIFEGTLFGLDEDHDGVSDHEGFSFPAVVDDVTGGDYYHNDILTSPYAVLAQYVTSISCTQAAENTDKELISIDLALFYDDLEYNSKINFAGRNKVNTGD